LFAAALAACAASVVAFCFASAKETKDSALAVAVADTPSVGLPAGQFNVIV
jgi:hypothetical protein